MPASGDGLVGAVAFTRRAGPCQPSAWQKGIQRSMEPCSFLPLSDARAWRTAYCSCRWKRLLLGAPWGIWQGEACVFSEPWEHHWPRGAVVRLCVVPAARVLLAPPRPRLFSVWSPHLLRSLTQERKLTLFVFLLWKQPNILGFLGWVGFERSVPQSVWIWGVGRFWGGGYKISVRF